MKYFKKETPGLSCAKKYSFFVFNSLLSVPTTMPAPTTTPEGKKETFSTQ